MKLIPNTLTAAFIEISTPLLLKVKVNEPVMLTRPPMLKLPLARISKNGPRGKFTVTLLIVPMAELVVLISRTNEALKLKPEEPLWLKPVRRVRLSLAAIPLEVINNAPVAVKVASEVEATVNPSVADAVTAMPLELILNVKVPFVSPKPAPLPPKRSEAPMTLNWK